MLLWPDSIPFPRSIHMRSPRFVSLPAKLPHHLKGFSFSFPLAVATAVAADCSVLITPSKCDFQPVKWQIMRDWGCWTDAVKRSSTITARKVRKIKESERSCIFAEKLASCSFSVSQRCEQAETSFHVSAVHLVPIKPPFNLFFLLQSALPSFLPSKK